MVTKRAVPSAGAEFTDFPVGRERLGVILGGLIGLGSAKRSMCIVQLSGCIFPLSE